MDNGNGHPHGTQSRLVLSVTALALAACGAALPPGSVATHRAGAAMAAAAPPSATSASSDGDVGAQDWKHA
jgi:hypothetical protein